MTSTSCDAGKAKNQAFQEFSTAGMIKIRFLLITLLLLLLGVSCSGINSTTTSSPSPEDYIPTAIELTIEAGHTVVPSSTIMYTPADFPLASPTPTPEGNPAAAGSSTPLANNHTVAASPSSSATSTPDLSATPSYRATRTPTITPTPTLPGAGVQFVMPGPMSRVASPLQMIVNLRSVPSGNYHIELWIEPLQVGGEPRLLYREVQRFISNPIPWLYLDQQIQFELSRVSEFGQLRVIILATDGQPVSINSVDLILLSMGTSTITIAGGKTEPIVIREPSPNQLIQGGKVIVSGLVKPSQDFMLAELVTPDGTVVGYRQIFVTPSGDGSYVPFTSEIPYEVESATWVRLRISESGTRISGMEHLSSVQVLLSP